MVRTLVGVSLLLGTVHAADLANCGERIAAGDTATLVGDLDCAGAEGVCAFPSQFGTDVACATDADCSGPRPPNTCVRVAVVLERRATLDLAGHTLAGGGVLCPRGCEVRNGSIVGAGAAVLGGGDSRFLDLTVRDGGHGIYLIRGRGRVTLTNVSAVDNALEGIVTAGTTRGTNVIASRNRLGGGVNVIRAKLVATDVTANDNFGNGVDGESVRVTNITAQRNGGAGVIAPGRVVIRGGTVTDNAPTYGVLDVQSEVRPRVRGLTCTRSFGPTDTGNWGICTDD